MVQDFTSRLIQRGLFNGLEYVGSVMKSASGDFIADIHDEPRRSDPVYGTFSDFESAEEFVRKQWDIKFSQNLHQTQLQDLEQTNSMVSLVNTRMASRRELLQSIYNVHFESGHRMLTVDFGFVDTEDYLKYQYLMDKGFIYMERYQNEEFGVRLTATGIDIIETDLALR